jgi:hypothetical protein
MGQHNLRPETPSRHVNWLMFQTRSIRSQFIKTVCSTMDQGSAVLDRCSRSEIAHQPYRPSNPLSSFSLSTSQRSWGRFGLDLGWIPALYGNAHGSSSRSLKFPQGLLVSLRATKEAMGNSDGNSPTVQYGYRWSSNNLYQ